MLILGTDDYVYVIEIKKSLVLVDYYTNFEIKISELNHCWYLTPLILGIDIALNLHVSGLIEEKKCLEG